MRVLCYQGTIKLWLGCPRHVSESSAHLGNILHFAVGMHVMLALIEEHGMQLECVPVLIFENIVRIT
jgi:hypothetical protein